MTTPKHTAAAPLLPPASVDFNALHDAMRKGTEAAAAAENAIVADTVMTPADAAMQAALTAHEEAAADHARSAKTDPADD